MNLRCFPVSVKFKNEYLLGMASAINHVRA